MVCVLISDLESLASRIARRCRWIIQGCLREEEWADADEAFADVIRQELASQRPGDPDALEESQ